MIGDQTAAKLRRIRTAGLSRLREIAQAQGYPWERDRKVLKDIANGSMEQAAEKSRLSYSSVQHILRRYDRLAQGIIEERRRKAMNYEEV